MGVKTRRLRPPWHFPGEDFGKPHLATSCKCQLIPEFIPATFPQPSMRNGERSRALCWGKMSRGFLNIADERR